MTRIRDGFVAALVLGCTICVATQETLAAQVFSVRTTSDELVRIDTVTGAISTVGALGFNAIDVDLASTNGRLFALNNDFGTSVSLIEINPLTGATITLSQVTRGGIGITSAEGMSNLGNQLVVGFDGATDAFSELLGDLSLDGMISNVTTFDPEDDFDGLGSDSAGLLYSTDGEARPAPYTTSKFFAVDRSGPPLAEIADFPLSEVAANDLIVADSTLLAIDGTNSVLHKIGLPGGTLNETIPLDGDTYFGLAAVVPVPPALYLFGSGLLGLIGISRRKKAA